MRDGRGMVMYMGNPVGNANHAWRTKAELPCARSHFPAILVALSRARSTKPRDGLSVGVFSKRSAHDQTISEVQSQKMTPLSPRYCST